MIYLIEEKNYDKVKELIGDISHGIFPGCVCNGNNPGWIYTDDPENPTSAFVYMKNLGGTLVGDSNNDVFNKSLKESLESHIVPQILKEGEKFVVLTGSNLDWDTAIESILESKDYDIDEVRRYRFKGTGKSLPKLNEEFEIKEITSELLNNNSIKNIDLLTNDIKEWWNTIDRFLELGCGFIAVKNNELCGWSYSVCIVDSRVEIYIETVKKYRSKGIGTTIASRFVQYCIEHGLKPEWEAMSDIEHSMKIAEKVGFEFDYDYKLFEFEIKNKH